MLLSIFIILYSLIFAFFIFKNLNNNNLYDDKRISKILENTIHLDNHACKYIKKKLEKRTRPFNYENEFIFFSSLISCKIPFSFIRFADCEENIMRGKDTKALDKWHWTPKLKKLRDDLIESVSICTIPNNFIGLPCKNWIHYSKSILSFSKCNSAKYMSYSTLFVNKNYLLFQNWITRFIYSSNRWKIILIANSNINKDISWAYKFFPVPYNVVEFWDDFSIYMLPILSAQAKKNNLIFFISAGPVGKIIISYLSKINNKNIYIDFGSSIEFITKGYSTRSHTKKNNKNSLKGCESFIIKNKTIIYD